MSNFLCQEFCVWLIWGLLLWLMGRCIFAGDLFTACRWHEIFASCWLWILSLVVCCCFVQSHKQVAMSLLAGRNYNSDLTLNLNLFLELCLMNLLLSAPGRNETTCKKNHSSFCGKDPTNCHWWNVSQVQFFTLPWSHISFLPWWCLLQTSGTIEPAHFRARAFWVLLLSFLCQCSRNVYRLPCVPFSIAVNLHDAYLSMLFMGMAPNIGVPCLVLLKTL